MIIGGGIRSGGILSGGVYGGGVSVMGGGTFNPASLFAGGVAGAWYDPSDISTLFQTNDTSTPVTASGQSVGRMNDKSGNGNHATQATASRRPVYIESAGRKYLEFDGVDDFLPVADNSGLRQATILIALAVERLSGSARADLSGCGNSLAFATNNWIVSHSAGTIQFLGRTPASILTFQGLALNTKGVQIFQSDGTNIVGYLDNGAEISRVGTIGTDNTTGAAVGQAAAPTLYFSNHRNYGEIILGNNTANAVSRQKLATWLGAKQGRVI